MPLLTASPVADRLDVTCDWSEKELIKSIPGARWDAQRKTWHVPRSWAAYVQLHGTFGGRLVVDHALHEWALERQAWADRARAWRQVVDPEVVVDGLFPWQVADFFWAYCADDGMLLGNDQGTGKTISCQYALYGLKDALPALVVCPNSVKRVWEQEARRWLPAANVYVIGGGAGARQKMLKQALADPVALIVINYEGLRSHSKLAPYGSIRMRRCLECGGPSNVIGQTEDLNGEMVDVIDPGIEVVKPSQCQVHKKELNDTGWIRSVIIDEAQALKDPKSQQTRAVWAVCHDPSVTRRIATTGTPIANHIGDLWSIMHAVAPLEYPVRSTFMDRYAQMSWNQFGGLDIVGLRQDTAAEFFQFFDPRYRRITKKLAAPWLPEKYRSTQYVTLPAKMRKAYDELEEQMITKFDDGTIVFAPNNLTQATRLLQVASAYGSTEPDGTYRMTDPSPKIDRLEEIVADREGRPLAVCAMSKQLINLAYERLTKKGVTCSLITGDVHELDRRRNLDMFQDGKLMVLLFTIGAGGTGLTMTAADTIVFLQRDWSLIRNLQAEDRVHRIGSEIHESVHVIDLVTENTIEEWQIERIHQKLVRLEEIRRDGLDLASIGDDIRHG